MRKEKISILLFLLFSSPCFAERNNNLRDTLNDKVNVLIAYRLPGFDFSIHDAEEKGKSIDYQANVPLTLNASVNYKSFGISVSKELSSSEDESKLGNTKYTDIQLHYYLKRYGCELFYQKYQGYYLANFKDFGYVQTDPNSVRPDINTQNIGLNFIYLFKKDHSLNTLLNQSVRPNEFDWTFLLMSSFNHFKLESSRNLIPASEMIYYGDNSDYRGGKYTVFSLAPGFSIAKPLRKFYASAVCLVGFGVSGSENQFGNVTQKGIEAFGKINLKFGLGYSGKRVTTGIAATVDSLLPMKEKSELVFQTFSGYVDLFIGFRL